MKIVVCADHAGFDLKEAIKNFDFREMFGFKVEFIDVGTYSPGKCDFPLYVKKAVKLFKKFVPWMRISRQKHFGVFICASGFGSAMVANRYRRIRAVSCRSEKDAVIAREKNNANVLCLGSKFVDVETATKIIATFVETKYYGNRRYNRRLRQF